MGRKALTHSILACGWTCVELLASLDAKTDEFPSQEDLSGAAMALLRLQDTYALSTKHLAAGNVQGISDSMSMSGMFCESQCEQEFVRHRPATVECSFYRLSVLSIFRRFKQLGL